MDSEDEEVIEDITDDAFEELSDDALLDEDEDYYEDEDFIEEDWDSYDDGVEDVAPKTKKKRSSKSDKIIIGLAVIIGLSVFVLKTGLFGGDSAEQGQPSVPQQQASVEETIIETPNIADEPVPSAPFVSQRDIIYGKGPRDNEQDSSVEGDYKGFLNDDFELNKLQQDAEIAESTVDLIYTEENIEQGTGGDILVPELVDENVPPLPNSVVDINTDRPDDSSGVSADDKKIVAFEDSDGFKKLETMFEQVVSRLDAMESNITLLRNNNDVGNKKMLSGAVSSLEAKISALSKTVATIVSSNKSQKKTSQSGSAASHVKSSIKNIAQAVKNTRAVKSNVVAPKSVVSKSGIKWVLKGARPGKAWVARAGSNEVYHVNVGDTLSGIGRITAIDNNDNIWVVRGVSGEVTQ